MAEEGTIKINNIIIVIIINNIIVNIVITMITIVIDFLSAAYQWKDKTMEDVPKHL